MSNFSKYEASGWRDIVELDYNSRLDEQLFDVAYVVKRRLVSTLISQNTDRLTVTSLETNGQEGIRVASTLKSFLNDERVSAATLNDPNGYLRIYRDLPPVDVLKQEYLASLQGRMGSGEDDTLGFVDIDRRPGEESYLGGAHLGNNALVLFNLKHFSC